MRTAAVAAAFTVSKYRINYQSAELPREETLSPSSSIERSHWRSPVPFLFSGLAAMLGLIAFALLMLACSYWKLSEEAHVGEDGNNRDFEEGTSAGKGESKGDSSEEKFLVIMAGEATPTFLATRKAAPFCDEKSSSTKTTAMET
ncbi:protein GLUTAMINE DUMPER 5-like [Andrographis paniculata]|uniref:protein GLUTAMINE DUMPER 5-like n=1 Tax=Andrographis paniculata TaxID=175694 RepID=UPI0021E886AB|nr:protein GLUTAMINE DUMPER 5-like [Andrographis paniculata]